MNKLCCLVLFLVNASFICGQGKNDSLDMLGQQDSTILFLRSQIDDLTWIQKSLKTELASLVILAEDRSNTRSSSAYNVQFYDSLVLVLDRDLVLVPSLENGKYAYTIAGFTSPHSAYALAQRLRVLDLNTVQVISPTTRPAFRQPAIGSSRIKSVRIGSYTVEE